MSKQHKEELIEALKQALIESLKDTDLSGIEWFNYNFNCTFS
jgi:hypothetical protein